MGKPLIQMPYPTYPLSNIPLIKHTPQTTNPHLIYPLSNIPLIQHTPYPTAYPHCSFFPVYRYIAYWSSNNQANNKQIICFNIRIQSIYNIDNYIRSRLAHAFYCYLNEASVICSNNDI